MANLWKASFLAAAIVLYAATAAAQTPTDSCKPARVIPLTETEPPAKIVIDPPLAEPLASRRVAIIQYCTLFAASSGSSTSCDPDDLREFPTRAQEIAPSGFH